MISRRAVNDVCVWNDSNRLLGFVCCHNYRHEIRCIVDIRLLVTLTKTVFSTQAASASRRRSQCAPDRVIRLPETWQVFLTFRCWPGVREKGGGGGSPCMKEIKESILPLSRCICPTSKPAPWCWRWEMILRKGLITLGSWASVAFTPRSFSLSLHLCTRRAVLSIRQAFRVESTNRGHLDCGRDVTSQGRQFDINPMHHSHAPELSVISSHKSSNS